MLKLEAIQSPDPLITGEILFFFPIIEIGRSLKCHLSIDDPLIKSQHIRLTLFQEGVMIENTKGSFFLSNKRKIQGKKYHKVGDSFQIGSTEFKIKEYDFSSISPLVDQQEEYRSFIKNKPHLIPILDSLEEELRDLSGSF